MSTEYIEYMSIIIVLVIYSMVYDIFMNLLLIVFMSKFIKPFFLLYFAFVAKLLLMGHVINFMFNKLYTIV